MTPLNVKNDATVGLRPKTATFNAPKAKRSRIVVLYRSDTRAD